MVFIVVRCKNLKARKQNLEDLPTDAFKFLRYSVTADSTTDAIVSLLCSAQRLGFVGVSSSA